MTRQGDSGPIHPRHKAKRRAKRARRRLAVAQQRERQHQQRGPKWALQ